MGRLPAPCDDISFQLTAARRRLERGGLAGFTQGCFNSQPPEGGWKNAYVTTGRTIRFNSQPPEGGWKRRAKAIATLLKFQLTAARRRLVFSP